MADLECPDGYSLCVPKTDLCYPTHKRCNYERYKGSHLYCPGLEHLKHCDTYECPHMLKCKNDYCIVTHMVCDGIEDCPEGEDEFNCEHFVCAGLLRCRLDDICVHPMDICDGVLHCLLSGDDESLCDLLSCPTGCVCRGTAVKCNGLTDMHTLSKQTTAVILHFVYVSSTYNLQHISRIVHLTITSSNFVVNTIYEDNFAGLINMLYLRIPNNNLETINPTAFKDMTKLLYIDLQHNFIHTIQSFTFSNLMLISYLNLSHFNLVEVHTFSFTGLLSLQQLNLSYNRIHMLKQSTFAGLINIRHIDLRYNPISHFDQDTFFSFESKIMIYFHKAYYCCYLKPNHECSEDINILHKSTQCNQLFEGNIYRAVIAILSSSAIAVNIFLQWHMRTMKKSPIYILLLRHSTAVDLFPPVYLLILDIVSLANNDNYVYLSTSWTKGSPCFILSVVLTVGFIMSKLLVFIVSLVQLIAVKSVLRNNFNTTHLYVSLIIGWSSITILATIKQLYFPVNNIHCFPLIVSIESNTVEDIVQSFPLLVMLIAIFGEAVINYMVVKYVRVSNKLVRSSKAFSNERALVKNAFALISIEVITWLMLIFILLQSYYNPGDSHRSILFISGSLYTSTILYTAKLIVNVF